MSQSLLDLIATQDDDIPEEAPAPLVEALKPEPKRSRARTDQRALVPEGTFRPHAVQGSEACADQAFGWRFAGGKRTWKAHALKRPPPHKGGVTRTHASKDQPRICAIVARRFGRRGETAAALRCYAASVRSARDGAALVGDAGVFASTDPALLAATRDAFAAVAAWAGAPSLERTRCASLSYDLCPSDPTALVRAAEALSNQGVRPEDRGARACLLAARAALLLVNAEAPAVNPELKHPAQLDELIIALRRHAFKIQNHAAARDALDRARRLALRVNPSSIQEADGLATGVASLLGERAGAAIAQALVHCADTCLLDGEARAPSDSMALGTTLVTTLVERTGETTRKADRGLAVNLAEWLAADATAPRRLYAANVEAVAARLINEAGATPFLLAARVDCLRKARDADAAWVALAEAIVEGVAADGVEAVRRAVFPVRVAAARGAVWVAPPKKKKKKKKKKFPRDVSDEARAARALVAALASTKETDFFARTTLTDLRAARAAPKARPTMVWERKERKGAPRTGSGAALEAALQEDIGDDAVERFLRVADTQLLWGRTAPAATPAPRKVPGSRRSPVPVPATKPRRQGCDCAQHGPHRRTCPLYKPPAAKPRSTEAGGFWAREAARRTDEVRGLYSGVEEAPSASAAPGASAAPKPKRAPSMKTCPACSLKVHNRRKTCPGCGATFAKKTADHWSGGVWRPAAGAEAPQTVPPTEDEDEDAAPAPSSVPPAAPPAAAPAAAPPKKRPLGKAAEKAERKRQKREKRAEKKKKRRAEGIEVWDGDKKKYVQKDVVHGAERTPSARCKVVAIRRIGDASWRRFGRQKDAAEAFGISSNDVAYLINDRSKASTSARQFEACRVQDNVADVLPEAARGPAVDRRAVALPRAETSDRWKGRVKAAE